MMQRALDRELHFFGCHFPLLTAGMVPPIERALLGLNSFAQVKMQGSEWVLHERLRIPRGFGWEGSNGGVCGDSGARFGFGDTRVSGPPALRLLPSPWPWTAEG